MISIVLPIIWWLLHQVRRLARPLLWLVAFFAVITAPFQLCAFIVGSCAIFGVHVPFVEFIDILVTTLLPYTTGIDYKNMTMGVSLLQMGLSMVINVLTFSKSLLLMVTPGAAAFDALNSHIELEAYKRASQLWNDGTYEMVLFGMGRVLYMFNALLLSATNLLGGLYPEWSVVISSGVYLLATALLITILRRGKNLPQPTAPSNTPAAPTIHLVFHDRNGRHRRSRSIGATNQPVVIDEPSLSTTQ